MMESIENMETIYLSKKGIKEIKKQVAQLERDRHKTIIDLHEQDKTDNHDERYARIEKLAQLDGIEAELEEKKEILRKAQPYPKTNRLESLAVTIGSVVELIDQAGRKYVYTIVNSVEANPSDGRISFKSPLGQSLLGKKIKDTIEWQMNNRKLRLTRIS
jgi:transcription elongation GreA/GreB family factor